MGLPLVVTNDLHYVHRAQAEAHDVLLCVGTGSNLDTPGRLRFESDRVLPEVAAEMVALFPDQREALRNTRRDRRDGRPAASEFGQLRMPALPGAGRAHGGELAAQGVRARPAPAATGGHPGAPGAPRLRAGRHRLDGLRRLLPDRGRLRPVRPRAGDPDHLPGQRAGLDRDLHAGDHAGGPDPLRAAVRALPQPRPRDDAGHRRGLRGRPPRRGHQLRHAASTARTTSPRSSPSARCSPGRRIRDVGRVLGMGYGDVDRIAKAVPNQLGIRLDEALELAPQLARDVRQRPAGPQAHRLREAARRGGAQRLDPRRRGRHQPRAADRADAAPEGDQLRRAR